MILIKLEGLSLVNYSITSISYKVKLQALMQMGVPKMPLSYFISVVLVSFWLLIAAVGLPSHEVNAFFWEIGFLDSLFWCDYLGISNSVHVHK